MKNQSPKIIALSHILSLLSQKVDSKLNPFWWPTLTPAYPYTPDPDSDFGDKI